MWILVCVDLENHICDWEEDCVQEKEEEKRDQLLNGEADHPDKEPKVVTESHKWEGLRESLYQGNQVEGKFEHMAIFSLDKNKDRGIHEYKCLGKVYEIPEVKEIIGGTQLIQLAHFDSHET